MTGAPKCGRAGAKTFRYRQSSLVLTAPNGDAGCAQCGPNAVAGRTPCHREAGCGGCQRRSPTGGAAYGTPRNELTPADEAPRSSPESTRTSGAWTREASAGEASATEAATTEASPRDGPCTAGSPPPTRAADESDALA